VLIKPAITIQPADQTIRSGHTTTMSVVATGPGVLSYEWYQDASGDTSAPVGANSASHTTPALHAGTSYWVRVSNLHGGADSVAAKVRVQLRLSVPLVTR
jgi:hypothetical protein